MSKVKALVLGEDTRSFLSLIRSLGEMGHVVHVICYDNTSPALQSKYIVKSWNINHQAYSEADWLTAVSEIINAESYDLVFPCDERSIFPLHALQASLDENTKLGIPNQLVLDNLFDKHKTKLIAQRLGISTAQSMLVELKETSFDSIKDTLALPFVVKPLESFSSDSLSKRNKVEIIANLEAFQQYTSNAKSGDMYLVEEYFAGTGEGISIFAVHGIVQYGFAHTRVHEPRSGGGSSYRKSIPIDQEMLSACKKICEETKYNGVGMFEFKHNVSTGKWILVEVNARFWGSLPLAIFAGIDFPKYYTQYLLDQYQLTKQVNINYRQQSRARSFTNDVYDARIEMNNVRHSSGIFFSYIFLIKRALGFLRFIGDECVDSYKRNDPGPFKTEFKQLVENFTAKFSTLFIRKKSLIDKQSQLIQDLRTASENNARILFVCYGNIMRSPFAEKYFNKLTSESGLKLNSESYGFHQKEGRNSPDLCQKCALIHGVDLSAHQSQWLKQTDIKENDVIIIFDNANEEKVKKYYNTSRYYKLSDFVNSDGHPIKEIVDPWGGTELAVKDCYRLIATAIETIHSKFNESLESQEIPK